MGTLWIIIIGIHVCSLLFLAAYLKRLFKYARRYTMPESKYTLLFGWVNLSHIVFGYITGVSLFILASTLFLVLANS